MRTAALVLVLLGLQSAQAKEYDDLSYPRWFVRFDVGAVGYDLPLSFRLQMLKLEFVGGPFRVGVAYADGWASGIGEDEGSVFLTPVYLGYTIMSRPRRQTFLWGHTYDVYLQAELAFQGAYADPPLVNVTVCADYDYWGIGAGAEAGYAFHARRPGSGDYGESVIHAGIRLRFLTFAIGF